ncbi:MAG: hypothetical protein M0C28_45170 [Candidatus Moduliflexus flocculans]|nr:hypothetical protein [Candidatus Moduliflexus flocculans]
MGVALFVGNLLDMFQVLHLAAGHLRGGHLAGLPLAARDPDVAVIVQVFVCFAIYAVVPNVFPSLEWARTRPGFLARNPGPDGRRIDDPGPAPRTSRPGGPRRSARPSARTTTEPAGGRLLRERSPGPIRQTPPRPRSVSAASTPRSGSCSWFGVDFSGFSKAQLMRGPLRLRRPVPVRPALPAERLHPARAQGRSRPLLRQGPHARPADPRAGGAGPAARRRALRRGGRGPQAAARLELGDHEAEARRHPRLRRLLGPRRRHRLSALARREHPLKTGDIPPIYRQMRTSAGRRGSNRGRSGTRARRGR